MNHIHSDAQSSGAQVPLPAAEPQVSTTLAVGDVLIRRDDTGYGIFNYRGEPVLELPVRTADEAARLAAEIVAPWHGGVRVDA